MRRTDDADDADEEAVHTANHKAMCVKHLRHCSATSIHDRLFHPRNDEEDQRIPPYMTIYGYRGFNYDSIKFSPSGGITYTYKCLAVCVMLGDDLFYRVNPSDTFHNITVEIIDDFPATKTKKAHSATKSEPILHIISDVNRKWLGVPKGTKGMAYKKGEFLSAPEGNRRGKTSDGPFSKCVATALVPATPPLLVGARTDVVPSHL